MMAGERNKEQSFMSFWNFYIQSPTWPIISFCLQPPLVNWLICKLQKEMQSNNGHVRLSTHSSSQQWCSWNSLVSGYIKNCKRVWDQVLYLCRDRCMWRYHQCWEAFHLFLVDHEWKTRRTFLTVRHNLRLDAATISQTIFSFLNPQIWITTSW